MKYILIIAMIWLCSCKTAQQIAAEKAAKAEQDRQAEIALIEKTRQRFPCDTPRSTIQTITEYLLGDTTYVDSVAFIHDTARVTVYKTKYIIDSAWVQQYRDSLAASYYAFDVAKQDASDQAKRADRLEGENKAIKEDRDLYRLITWIGGGIIFLFIGVSLVWKITTK